MDDDNTLSSSSNSSAHTRYNSRRDRTSRERSPRRDYEHRPKKRSPRRDYEHRPKKRSSRRDYEHRPKSCDEKTTPKYPQELLKLFSSSECKLCSLELTDPLMAKLHYSGKQHLKKIKIFLGNWCERTGNRMPKLDQPEYSSFTTEYCDLCNVRLISSHDKLIHFSGKSHQKKILNEANAKKKTKAWDPVNLGKWLVNDFEYSPEVNNKLSVNEPQEYQCKLCYVKAITEKQFQVHLKGKKHAASIKKSDTSVKRTVKPYYCDVCDVYINSLGLYRIHQEGKKHKKMLSIKKSQDADEKVSIQCPKCPFVGNIQKHRCTDLLNKFDYADLENKWVCYSCPYMAFDSEEKYKDHLNSDKHSLSVLNPEDNDKVQDDCYYCFICSKQCISHKDFTDHVFGEDHIKRLQQCETELYYCSVCNFKMNRKTNEEHVVGYMHLRNVHLEDIKNTLVEMAKDPHTTMSTSFPCRTCDVTMNSFVKYSDHLYSDDHIKRLIKKNNNTNI